MKTAGKIRCAGIALLLSLCGAQAMARGGGGGHGGGHAGHASHLGAPHASGHRAERADLGGAPTRDRTRSGTHPHSGFRSVHRSTGAFARAQRPSATSEHLVASHYRRDGGFVASHYATNPDATRNNNCSTVGNVNPHTGAAGTQPRDAQ